MNSVAGRWIRILCAGLLVWALPLRVFAQDPRAVEVTIEMTATSQERKPGLVVAVVDHSDSMNQTLDSTRSPIGREPTRWDETVRALKGMLSAYQQAEPKGYDLRMFVFDTDPARPSDSDRHVFTRITTEASLQATEKRISDISKPFGNTALYKSVVDVSAWILKDVPISEYGWVEFVVFSDGADSETPSSQLGTTREQLRRNLQELKSRFQITPTIRLIGPKFDRRESDWGSTVRFEEGLPDRPAPPNQWAAKTVPGRIVVGPFEDQPQPIGIKWGFDWKTASSLPQPAIEWKLEKREAPILVDPEQDGRFLIKLKNAEDRFKAHEIDLKGTFIWANSPTRDSYPNHVELRVAIPAKEKPPLLDPIRPAQRPISRSPRGSVIKKSESIRFDTSPVKGETATWTVTDPNGRSTTHTGDSLELSGEKLPVVGDYRCKLELRNENPESTAQELYFKVVDREFRITAPSSVEWGQRFSVNIKEAGPLGPARATAQLVGGSQASSWISLQEGTAELPIVADAKEGNSLCLTAEIKTQESIEKDPSAETREMTWQATGPCVNFTAGPTIELKKPIADAEEGRPWNLVVFGTRPSGATHPRIRVTLSRAGGQQVQDVELSGDNNHFEANFSPNPELKMEGARDERLEVLVQLLEIDPKTRIADVAKTATGIPVQTKEQFKLVPFDPRVKLVAKSPTPGASLKVGQQAQIEARLEEETDEDKKRLSQSVVRVRGLDGKKRSIPIGPDATLDLKRGTGFRSSFEVEEKHLELSELVFELVYGGRVVATESVTGVRVNYDAGVKVRYSDRELEKKVEDAYSTYVVTWENGPPTVFVMADTRYLKSIEVVGKTNVELTPVKPPSNPGTLELHLERLVRGETPEHSIDINVAYKPASSGERLERLRISVEPTELVATFILDPDQTPKSGGRFSGDAQYQIAPTIKGARQSEPVRYYAIRKYNDGKVKEETLEQNGILRAPEKRSEQHTVLVKANITNAYGEKVPVQVGEYTLEGKFDWFWFIFMVVIAFFVAFVLWKLWFGNDLLGCEVQVTMWHPENLDQPDSEVVEESPRVTIAKGTIAWLWSKKPGLITTWSLMWKCVDLRLHETLDKISRQFPTDEGYADRFSQINNKDRALLLRINRGTPDLVNTDSKDLTQTSWGRVAGADGAAFFMWRISGASLSSATFGLEIGLKDRGSILRKGLMVSWALIVFLEAFLLYFAVDNRWV